MPRREPQHSAVPQAIPAAQASSADQWVDEHGDALFNYAVVRLRGDRAAAEEVVQETFLAALRSAESFRGQSSRLTWLTGILRHKLIDHLRKSIREQPMGDVAGEEDEAVTGQFNARGRWRTPPAGWTPEPSQLMERREFWQVFEQCMGHLPARVSAAFLLRMLEETPPEQVCKELSISPTNLWVLLHRARNRLRRCLELHWFGRSQGPKD